MAKEIWKPGNMLYPLPAVMASCGDQEGRTNIITVAWTGTVCTNPAMVYISVRPQRYSYDIIECRVTEVKELGSHHMFLARVEAVQADTAYMDEAGRFHLNDAGLVAYSHGEYMELGKKRGSFGYSVKKKKRR